MFKTIIFVALGGAIGSLVRFAIAEIFSRFWGKSLPIGTLTINVIGCLLIGLLVGYLQKWNIDNTNARYFLITGICGGFTTFSAFGYENQQLLVNQNFVTATIYITLSVVLGIAAVSLGLFMTKL